MKLLASCLVFSMFLGCSCSTTSDAKKALLTAKHNPKQLTCRLILDEDEDKSVDGVYCITYEGPKDLRAKK